MCVRNYIIPSLIKCTPTANFNRKIMESVHIPWGTQSFIPISVYLILFNSRSRFKRS